MSQLIYGVEAFILHSRPYRNTSLILDCLTADYGRIAVAARSARGTNSRFRGQCQLFVPLIMNIRQGGAMYSLQSLETMAPTMALQGDALLCALYVNELFSKFLHAVEANTELFDLYKECLQQLQNPEMPLTITLRLLEKNLLSALGYDICWTHTADDDVSIVPEGFYNFQLQYGFTLSDKFDSMAYPGSSLLAMQNENISITDANVLKRLMRQRITFYLNGTKLNSRMLW